MKTYRLYTDGSYTKAKSDRTTGAMAFIDDNNNLLFAQRYVTYMQSIVATQSNGGELMAARGGLMVAAGYIASKHPNEKVKVQLCHDYNGIKFFVEMDPRTGKIWRPSKSATAIYQLAIKTIKEMYPNMELEFVKVKAHTGEEWNELVDAIANGIIPKEYEDKMLKEYTMA